MEHVLVKLTDAMLKLTTVTLIALLSMSPPQNQADEIAALRKEVEALKAQQAKMQRDLQTIVSLLQSLAQQKPAGPDVPGLVGSMIPLAGEPALGSASARVTVVEVSDYHCPFCRRNVKETFPQLDAEYFKTGKARYVFVDYPIAQLHPNAFKSHEAAACAGEQGKYWEMHNALFASPPISDPAGLTAQASKVGLDMSAFNACFTSGRHSASIQESAQRMEKLGIGGTPMTLIGFTPAPGAPMKVVSYVYGAMPYAQFKSAIDDAINQAK
jgi:protein-disulfide isomerase